MPGKNVKGSDLLEFALEHCKAIDFFLAAGETARSCANDSFVSASTFDDLVSRLDAVLLWTRTRGFENFGFRDGGSWLFKTSSQIDFVMTVLPDDHIADAAWLGKIKKVEQSGLPVQPYLGDTLPKAITVIQHVVRHMVMSSADLRPSGKARAGWTVNLQDEYDCQNLFYTVVKPWLPALGREEVAVYFDEQKKISDFSLFEGKLIIEMKFVDSSGSKAQVGKTLEGLAAFYRRNSNVQCLLMIVFVKVGTVNVDPAKWEAEFSHPHNAPSILTMVVEVP
jgi:hypothetical protein